MRTGLITAALLLAGCGQNNGLKPQAGKALPPPAYGATQSPTAAELIRPSSQARPQRSDELLRKSEERRGDEFDLPPS